MDVKCPRCKTEYDFDASRIAAQGVTVKCAQCAYVFVVKLKAPAGAEPPPAPPPSAPPVAAAAPDLPPAGVLPPASPAREWKVRQPSGNVYTCKELTTLQRWIVEAKVHRDDEISLSGDIWKRLGNIPELASFFQVAEEAQKARAYEALRSSSVQLMAVEPPVAPPPPSAPPAAPTPLAPPTFAPAAAPEPSVMAPRITDTWREPQFGDAVPPPAASSPAFDRQPERMPAPSFVAAPPQPTFTRQPSNALSEEELEELARPKQSGSGKWLALAAAGLIFGGGIGYYVIVYMPEQQRLAEERDAAAAAEKAKAEAERAAADKKLVEAAVNAALDAGPAVAVAGVDAGVRVLEPLDAGAVAAVVPVVVPDAGAAPVAPVAVAAVDAGQPTAAPVPNVPLVPKAQSFDQLLVEAERLRDREKAAQALTAYGKAADLRPDRVEPYAGKGLALLDMGQPLQAEATFEQALKLNSRYGPAIMGMAEALRAQNKNARAVEFYERYLEVMPEGSEAAVARNQIERLKK